MGIYRTVCGLLAAVAFIMLGCNVSGGIHPTPIVINPEDKCGSIRTVLFGPESLTQRFVDSVKGCYNTRLTSCLEEPYFPLPPNRSDYLDCMVRSVNPSLDDLNYYITLGLQEECIGKEDLESIMKMLEEAPLPSDDNIQFCNFLYSLIPAPIDPSLFVRALMEERYGVPANIGFEDGFYAVFGAVTSLDLLRPNSFNDFIANELRRGSGFLRLEDNLYWSSRGSLVGIIGGSPPRKVELNDVMLDLQQKLGKTDTLIVNIGPGMYMGEMNPVWDYIPRGTSMTVAFEPNAVVLDALKKRTFDPLVYGPENYLLTRRAFSAERVSVDPKGIVVSVNPVGPGLDAFLDTRIDTPRLGVLNTSAILGTRSSGEFTDPRFIKAVDDAVNEVTSTYGDLGPNPRRAIIENSLYSSDFNRLFAKELGEIYQQEGFDFYLRFLYPGEAVDRWGPSPYNLKFQNSPSQFEIFLRRR
ncbi:MAG: hypothetical protein QXY45_01115 [Candidatus Aenigmatarchaeota archaeon]